MSYSLRLVTDISPSLMAELAMSGCSMTHAHNPGIVKILYQTFGWEGGAFEIMEDTTPVGYISCMFIKGRIVSVPHFSYGGILSAKPLRTGMYKEILPLLNHYFSGSSSHNIPYLIRDPERISDFALDTKIVSWIPITNVDIEQAVPSAQMAKARKAIENGLFFKSGGFDLLTDFYRVYAWNMLRLGSPVLPLKLFAAILKNYSNGDARIFCVYKEKTPVGAAFLMSYKGFFENTWFSTLPEHNSCFPAQLLHLEMIRYSVQQQGHTYSFGRSSAGSGVHEFKRRWKTEETIIYWNYDKPLKHDMRKAEFLSKIWRLLPLKVANILGPVAGKWIY